MNPGVPTARAVRVLGRIVYPLVRVLHRATLEGIEHLPANQPYLLIGNHPPSCGTGEFLSLMALWAHHFGSARPLAGYTHIAAHRIWPVGWIFREIGAIPSTYEAAEAALAARTPIAMFPGGDYEGFQPFWHSRTDFNGREGFLRIARKAGVPIVPFSISGASAPVLLRIPGWLAIWPRALGVKRYAVTVLGAIVAALIVASSASPWRWLIAYVWLASPLSLMSWLPTRVRVRIGAPIAPTSTHDVEAAIDSLRPRA